MKSLRVVVVLAAIMSLTAIPVSSASATTVEQCQAELANLRSHTVASRSSFTNERDFESVVAKLDAASAKLTAGNGEDAVQKLTDFQTKLNALATAAKPKVDPEVAQSLASEAQGVIDCINGAGA